MRKRASQYLVIGFAILLSAGLAMAAGSNNERGNSISKDEANFLQKTIEAGMMQVELGQLAEGKAASEKVREFGQRMVQDHSAVDGELKRLMEKKDIKVPKELQGEPKATVDRLSKLSGKDFDRAYMKTMVSDHQKDIKEFKKEASQSRDPDIEEFAATRLPVLERHLGIAQSIGKEVGANVAQEQSNG